MKISKKDALLSILRVFFIPQDDTSIGLYQREISLKVRCEKLVSVRNERESTWTELSSTNRKLASAIGRPAFSVEPNLRLRTEVLDTLRVKNDELSAAFVRISSLFSQNSVHWLIDWLTVCLTRFCYSFLSWTVPTCFSDSDINIFFFAVENTTWASAWSQRRNQDAYGWSGEGPHDGHRTRTLHRTGRRFPLDWREFWARGGVEGKGKSVSI